MFYRCAPQVSQTSIFYKYIYMHRIWVYFTCMFTGIFYMRDFQVYFSRYVIQVSFPGVFSWFLIQVSPTGMCSRCAWVPHPGPWSGWPCSTSSAGLTCRGTPAAPSSGAGRPPPPTSPAGAGRAPAHSVALQLHTKEVGCYYSQEAETLQLVHTVRYYRQEVIDLRY